MDPVRRDESDWGDVEGTPPRNARELIHTALQPLENVVSAVTRRELTAAIWAGTQGRARAALFPVFFAFFSALFAVGLLGLVGRIYSLTIPLFGFCVLTGAWLFAFVASRIADRWASRATPEFTVFGDLYDVYAAAQAQSALLVEDLQGNHISPEEIDAIVERRRNMLLKAYLTAIIEVTHSDGAGRSQALQRQIADLVLRIPRHPDASKAS